MHVPTDVADLIISVVSVIVGWFARKFHVSNSGKDG